jgi:hypothetical protein
VPETFSVPPNSAAADTATARCLRLRRKSCAGCSTTRRAGAVQECRPLEKPCPRVCPPICRYCAPSARRGKHRKNQVMVGELCRLHEAISNEVQPQRNMDINARREFYFSGLWTVAFPRASSPGAASELGLGGDSTT